MHAASSAASAMHPASAQRSSLCGQNMSGDLNNHHAKLSKCPKNAMKAFSFSALSSGPYPQRMSFAQPNAMAAFASGMVSQNCSIIQDAHSRRAELCSYGPVNNSVPKGNFDLK
jgi:hypothetical protein